MHRYNLDSLVFRNRLAFGWGWFVDLNARVFPVDLVLQHVDRSVSIISCLRSGTRSDVAEAFPDVPHAAASGFMMQGRLESDSPVSTAKLMLSGTNPDGSDCCIALELGSLNSILQHDTSMTASRIARILRRRGWRSNLRLASKKLRGRIREAFGSRLHRRDILGAAGAVLIFDHDLGGGANTFRRQLISRIRRRNSVCLIVPRVQTLDYSVTMYNGASKAGRIFAGLDDLLKFIDEQHWISIIINELVSYPDPIAIVRWLNARLTAGFSSLNVTLYLHDFYSACPQWTLVGRRGVYCGVPDLGECERCIKSLRIPFLPYLSNVSIRDWRAEWEPLLRNCTIHAFSLSTVRIFKRAFPSVDDTKIRVEPHSMDYFKGRPIDYERNPSRYRIGVVGHINGPKGASMVELAAKTIQERALPIELVIFGSIDATGRYEAIIHAGEFTPENLADMLEEYEINATWVPSVCPETYSYVTSELIRLNVPLVCFDVGAPAERVSQYQLGHVVPNFDAAAVVDYFDHLQQLCLLNQQRSMGIHSDASI